MGMTAAKVDDAFVNRIVSAIRGSGQNAARLDRLAWRRYQPLLESRGVRYDEAREIAYVA